MTNLSNAAEHRCRSIYYRNYSSFKLQEKVSWKPWDASEVSLNNHQVLKQGRAYSIGMERRQSIMHINGSISIPMHSWREALAQCLTKGTGQDWQRLSVFTALSHKPVTWFYTMMVLRGASQLPLDCISSYSPKPHGTIGGKKPQSLPLS